MTRRSIEITGLVFAMLTAVSYDSASAGQPLPGGAQYRGMTATEWCVLQNEWAIATGLGEGTDIPDTVNKVRLLPGGFGGGIFEFDIAVEKGTGIAVSPWFAFGEVYNDGTPPDDPEDPFLVDIINFIFANRTVDVWLDGELVLSGVLDDLGEYAYPPTFFDEPIPYSDQSGPAVGAIWTVGVCSVFHPLTPGEHTLFVSTDGPFFGLTEITYNISVE